MRSKDLDEYGLCFPRKSEAVISAAKENGLIVSRSPTCVEIKRGKKDGLLLWLDGTATRMGSSFECTTTIRTKKDMLSVLRLTNAA